MTLDHLHQQCAAAVEALHYTYIIGLEPLVR